MKSIEESTILKIQAYGGDIEIPFLSLELLDDFTVRYNNKEELLDALIGMLNLSIDKEQVREVYVYYAYLRKDTLREKNTVVKYRKDNFDRKLLISFMKDFLKKNHDMIRCCGVRKIRSKGIFDFNAGIRDIQDYEIDYAVDKYFEGAPYGVFRKVYFFLKNNGVKPKINRCYEKRTMIERNLTKIHSADDYVQSLLSRARYEEDSSLIYDELSRIDLEDLRTLLTDSHYGLFDGIGTKKAYLLEDLYDLEDCTGYDIEVLTEMVTRNRKNGRNK